MQDGRGCELMMSGSSAPACSSRSMSAHTRAPIVGESSASTRRPFRSVHFDRDGRAAVNWPPPKSFVPPTCGAALISGSSRNKLPSELPAASNPNQQLNADRTGPYWAPAHPRGGTACMAWLGGISDAPFC